ncbi:hypothetical protein [Thalassospira xiamenensis]|uniref:hypothetical protein n=1 Tax=Thalassospira xiamenensis TaxID=220697 RepID=UPI0011BD79FA|nr:hypothetical protein [Thalassospira xiamenensis]
MKFVKLIIGWKPNYSEPPLEILKLVVNGTEITPSGQSTIQAYWIDIGLFAESKKLDIDCQVRSNQSEKILSLVWIQEGKHKPVKFDSREIHSFDEWGIKISTTVGNLGSPSDRDAPFSPEELVPVHSFPEHNLPDTRSHQPEFPKLYLKEWQYVSFLQQRFGSPSVQLRVRCKIKVALLSDKTATLQASLFMWDFLENIDANKKVEISGNFVPGRTRQYIYDAAGKDCIIVRSAFLSNESLYFDVCFKEHYKVLINGAVIYQGVYSSCSKGYLNRISEADSLIASELS